MKPIALLGGTFDPIHNAHLRTAVELLNMGFEEVRLLPNAIPPHRSQPVALPEQRLAMLKLAAEAIPNLHVDDIELKRSDMSFTADTVSEIRQQLGDEANLTWVMGTDAWQGFDRWHLPEQILEKVNLLVVSRICQVQPQGEQQLLWLQERQVQPQALFDYAAGRIAEVQWPLLDISATQIRSLLRENKRTDFLLPQAVIEYIKTHEIY